MKIEKLSVGLIFGLCLAFSIPLWFGYTFLPTDLLSLVQPWKAALGETGFQNHYYVDVINEQLPWKILFSNQIKEGILPLWNHYNLNGTPFLALSTPQLLSPLNVFFLFLPPNLANDLSLLTGLFVAGFSFSLLLKYYELRGVPNAIGSLAYILNGAFLINAHVGWMIGAFAWFPLVILFLEKSVVSHRFRDLCLASLFMGMAFLGGNLQIYVHMFLILLPWVFYRAYRGWKIGPIKFVLFVALALCVAAVSLLPTLELLSAGWSRAGEISLKHWFLDIDKHLLKIPFLVSFLIPHFFGFHKIFSPVLFSAWQWNDFVQGYIGFIPLILGSYVCCKIRHPVVAQYRFIGLIILAVLFFSPLVEWLYGRALVTWCFVFSILAAFGAEILWKREAVDLGHFKKIIGGLWVLLVISLGLATIIFSHFQDTISAYFFPIVKSKIQSNPYVSLYPFYLQRVVNTIQYYSFKNPALVLTLGIVGLFWVLLQFYLRQGLSVKWFHRGLLLLVLIDLVCFAGWYMPVVDLEKYPLYPETPSVQFLKKDTDLFRVLPIEVAGVDDPIFFMEGNIPANVEIPIHTGSINYKPAIQYSKLLYHRKTKEMPFSMELANLANVKYFATQSFPFDRLGLRLVYDGEIKLYENKKYLPRFFFPPRLESATQQEAFQKINEPSFKASEIAYVDLPFHQFPAQQGKGARRAVVEKYGSDIILLSVQVQYDQILLLLDTYYPGWKAMLDGKETPIYRANAIFRAISVPRGKHQIVFQFQPLSFWVGFWITLSALALIACVVLVSSLNSWRHS